MTGEAAVDLGENRKFGVVDLAVHIDGDQFLCRLLDLTEEFSHTGCLPRARQSPADGIERAAATQSGADLECEFPDLVFAVMELLRDIIQFQDFRVPEEGLIPHQQVFFHRTLLWDMAYIFSPLFS
jgi:hypothetical protein